MTTPEHHRHWHRQSADQVARRLDTDPRTGLEHRVAAERLTRHGPNDVEGDEQRGLFAIVLSQFMDFMILILLAAAIVSSALGGVADAIVIGVIVALNAAVGAVQEARAQRAIVALRRMAAPEARVIRSGTSAVVPAAELVPGDVVVIEAGNVVPADLRLVESRELAADESALTGEAIPVDKHVAALDSDEELPLGDRLNMAFKSTSVTKGRGTGIVVATGAKSEIGRIAGLLAQSGTLRTPLQQRLAVFGRRLALAVLAICALLLALGIARGEPPMLMFLTAVSLAVAAIPEALPAVVTVSLALGARRLSRQNALVRRLPAVESLGSVTYICTDKTGTLTENRMVLESLFAAGSERAGLDALDGTLRRRLGEALALCNAVAVDNGELTGDPTEVALVRAAASAGFEKRALLRESPLVGELAFDSARKRMTTVHERHGRRVAYVKGAPEQTVSRCRDTLGADGDTRVLEAAPLLEEAEKLAGRGHRVLAVAYRELPAERHALRADEIEAGLTFLAFVALDDPPRVEARQAIEDCRLAGITPVMITGDHPVTARQIAATLALTDDDEISTGRQVAELDDERLLEHVRRVRVYARVDPEQKIRIVEALQRSGELVAMTGDGVNDAPALKQATIGVAMGKRGTDVAREAADMVLLDDNFATIVMAIREGRRVYDNIRKFIRYTMTSNAGEIWVLLLAPLIGLPLPLLPIHILWINLVTDGFPGLAFSGERAEADVMRRPPRPPGESVFAHGTWQHIFWAGLVIAGLSLVTAAWTGTQNLVYWQTMVFTTLVTAQLFQALALRSEISSLARIGLFSNPYMIVTVAATLAAQLIVVYAPPFNALLHTAPLGLADLSMCLALGFAMLPVIEIQKWLARRRRTAAPLRAVERA